VRLTRTVLTFQLSEAGEHRVALLPGRQCPFEPATEGIPR